MLAPALALSYKSHGSFSVWADSDISDQSSSCQGQPRTHLADLAELGIDNVPM